MFSGNHGVGKRAAARYFAKACNCSRTSDRGAYSDRDQYLSIGSTARFIKPCNACRSCKKIISGTHPDIIEINPDGASIKISQIRSLNDTVSLKPYEANHRVVIICDAHTMNPSAGNALLKLLEEPPGRTLFILTAKRSSDHLPTVVSRCQHIRFQPISERGIKKWLVDTERTAPGRAESVARMANGSYARALRLAEIDWFALRGWAIGAVEAFHESGVPGALAFAEKLSGKPDLIPDTLLALQTWFRDLCAFICGADNIVNIDLAKEIDDAAGRWNKDRLVRCLQLVTEALNAIQTQANKRRAVEAMALGLLIEIRKYSNE